VPNPVGSITLTAHEATVIQHALATAVGRYECMEAWELPDGDELRVEAEDVLAASSMFGLKCL